MLKKLLKILGLFIFFILISFSTAYVFGHRTPLTEIGAGLFLIVWFVVIVKALAFN